ncbi:hypothetical protein Godav_006206 [Gossypium davidsonii]|uniref:Uncharacterized protein n=1 Tax=Gossypium davidsonii TaxID=34287 RepID=A0A7J8S392_GOSDV|nr:hypothetical protein [Gossypium davidsonii]
MIPKDFAMVLIVQEFYASLQDDESRKVEGRTWETILVRGKEVQITRYIKLQNKRQQEMMAASASSQRKEKSTTHMKLDIFGMTYPEQEGEEQKSEEEEGTEEGEEDDEMDFEEND